MTRSAPAADALPASLSRLLAAELGGRWSVQALGASAFCATWQAMPSGGSGSGPLFLKSVSVARSAVLEAEADGLSALASTRTIRVPAVAGCWTEPGSDTALLAIEWLDFVPPSGAGAGERLGRRLAALHAAAPPAGEGRFGWRCDNWIGATPQRNRWSARGGLDGWIEFLATERLGALADRLEALPGRRALADATRRVADRLPTWYDDGHVPRASLVHGDLWSGNQATLADGEPVIFDPAVSVSCAEAELAMMELFGAPPPGFWPAYRESFGLHPGYPRRRPLHQLYPLLNHVLLFGGSYERQVQALITALLGRG